MTVLSIVPPVSDADRFLSALFPEIPAGAAMLIWTLPDKRSEWFASGVSPLAYIETVRTEKDIYVGVGLRKAGLGEAKRGTDMDVIAFPGLVADFDLAGPGHKKKGLPESEDQINDLISALPLKVSMLIGSGHGFQAYWLFKELWLLETRAARKLAQAYSRGWNDLIQAEAKKREMSVDAVFDLARVMRVPGTLNHKSGEHRAVTLKSIEEHRCNPDDFEPYASKMTVETIKGKLGGIELNSSAEPPFDLHNALLVNDEKYAASWRRTRKEPNFTSASEYDMSLARLTVQAGWTDQQIANLLIASRRTHGDSLKLREDYYARTILKAREKQAGTIKTKELEEKLDESLETAETNGEPQIVDEETKDMILGKLHHMTGIPADRIIRYGEQPGDYRVVLKDERIAKMGAMEKFKAFDTWWDRAFELTGRAPKVAPKRNDWMKMLSMLQPLIEAFEQEELNESSALVGLVRIYIEGVGRLVDHSAMTHVQRMPLVASGEPFRLGDRTYITLEHMRSFLARRGDRFELKTLAAMLKSAAWRSERIQLYNDREEKRISRNYWSTTTREIE